MPTIVSIGYTKFVLKNDAAAAAILKAFIGAVQLEEDYKNGKSIYWPAERQRPVSVETIKASQLRPCKPGDDDVTVHGEMRRVGNETQKLIG